MFRALLTNWNPIQAALGKSCGRGSQPCVFGSFVEIRDRGDVGPSCHAEQRTCLCVLSSTPMSPKRHADRGL
jgi:hypothetical protein